MRRNKDENILLKISKYLPVFIILLSITIIVGSTFAYFTDKKEVESNLTFTKVELSSETTTGINGELHDVIPGSKLVDGVVSFSKSIDSEALYVRAKISFSLPSVYANDTKMQELVNKLRTSTDFNINSVEQYGAVWSEKQGNYFYLLNNADKTKLMRIDNINTYVLSNEIIVPRDLEQLEENYQYMKSFNFHLAFEAIQADNVSDVLNDTKQVFNELFPISASETFEEDNGGKEDEVFETFTLTLNNGEEVVTVNKYEGVIIDTPTAYKSNHAFDGWYTQDGSTNGNWGEKVVFPLTITKDTQMYAKFTQRYSEGLEFTPIQEDGVTVAYGVSGSYCKDVDIIIPETYNGLPVTTVVENAFQDMFLTRNIESVSLPDTITTIEGQAFGACVNLKSIVIPKNVTSIKNTAFESCFYLYEVYNYSNLDIIAGDSNHGEVALNAIEVYSLGETSKVEVDENGYEFYFDGKDNIWLLRYPGKNFEISGEAVNPKDIILPENYKGYPYSIHANVFSYDIDIENIILPDGLKIIGKAAFGYCYYLKEINIPDSVIAIEDSAFDECENLTNINLPSSLERFGSNFYNCDKLVEIVNKSTKEIIPGQGNARYCLNVVEDESQSNIKVVGDYKFYDDGENVYLIQYMGDSKELILPEYYNGKNYSIYNKAFIYSLITDIVVPDSVIGLGSKAFSDCTNLKTVKLSNAITVITSRAFDECNRLYSIELSENLTEIQEYAFYSCYNLNTFKVTSLVTTIGSSAFSNCLKLIEIYNYSSLNIQLSSNEFGEIGKNALHIYTTDVESKITVQDGLVFYDDGAGKVYLIGKRNDDKVLNLPDYFNSKVYNIYHDAFYYNRELTSVTISPYTVEIGEAAFFYCYNLNFVIPKTLTTLGNHSLFGMPIENIRFDGNVSEWKFGSSGYIFSSKGLYATDEDLVEIQANDGYISYQKRGCLIEGTMITLANGSKKAIENITYDDLLLVWNYDLGCFDYQYPIWIEKTGTTSSYTKVTLENGLEVGAVDIHGIFNADLNRFVNMCETSDEFYVGCSVLVYDKDENGNSVLTQRKVVSIELVHKQVNYYQIVSANYYNIFANDILTTEGNVLLSNRYGFDDNMKWNINLRNQAKENGYSYDEFSDIIERYLFEALNVREGKFLVEQGYLTEDEFRFFIVNEVANIHKIIAPNTTIKEGREVRIWSVTTSSAGEIFNSVKVVEGESFILPLAKDVDGRTFVGYRCSADGKIYKANESVVIWYGTHFTAIYE